MKSLFFPEVDSTSKFRPLKDFPTGDDRTLQVYDGNKECCSRSATLELSMLESVTSYNNTISKISFSKFGYFHSTKRYSG
jgi:hypothetical protein